MFAPVGRTTVHRALDVVVAFHDEMPTLPCESTVVLGASIAVVAVGIHLAGRILDTEETQSAIRNLLMDTELGGVSPWAHVLRARIAVVAVGGADAFLRVGGTCIGG